MDNRINEIRKRIRALRVSMLAAEATMRDQINQDEECAAVAGEILAMRAAMSLLAGERTRLGDREPIMVNNFFIPRRALEKKTSHPVKRRLVPAKKRAR